jgi:hypothetical protein
VSRFPEALQCLVALMRSELARASEAHTTLLCSLAAFAGPGADQLALELGQASEHGDHQLAVRRGGVREKSAGFGRGQNGQTPVVSFLAAPEKIIRTDDNRTTLQRSIAS